MQLDAKNENGIVVYIFPEWAKKSTTLFLYFVFCRRIIDLTLCAYIFYGFFMGLSIFDMSIIPVLAVGIIRVLEFIMIMMLETAGYFKELDCLEFMYFLMSQKTTDDK